MVSSETTQPFRLMLRLHTPLILPRVVPRLDTLLQEAACRQHLNWSQLHTLPLVFDDARGGYRASQLIFGVTPHHGLVAQEIGLTSGVSRLPFASASGMKSKLRIDGGPQAPKLTRHPALLSPFVVFYGEGQLEACLQLLSHTPHIGLEHARGQGAISIEAFQEDDRQHWRQRPWRQAAEHHGMGYNAIPDQLRMHATGNDEPVYRPPRILKEVV